MQNSETPDFSLSGIYREILNDMEKIKICNAKEGEVLIFTNL